MGWAREGHRQGDRRRERERDGSGQCRQVRRLAYATAVTLVMLVPMMIMLAILYFLGTVHWCNADKVFASVCAVPGGQLGV